MNLDDVCNLNNRVGLRCWELSCDSRAFNVKTQNAERRDLGVLSFARQALNMVEILNVELNLAVSFLLALGSKLPVAFFNLDPSHAANLTVNHESESVRHIAFVSCFTQHIFIRKTYTFLNYRAQLGHEFRVRNVYTQKLLLRFLIVHNWKFFDHVDLDHCIVAVDA